MTRRNIASLSLFLFFFPNITFAVDQDIFISEIQIEGESANDDFVELYNQSSNEVSLKGWRLCRRTKGNTSACESGSSSLIKTFSSNEKIPASGYYLWTNGDGEKYTDIPADTHTKQALTANNSLAIYNATGTLIDALSWGSGHTLLFAPIPLLTNPDPRKSHIKNFASLLWEENKSPTPTNSHGQTLILDSKPDPNPVPPPSTPATYNIRINELLPNPSGKDDGEEWVELFNFGSSAIDLTGWMLITASGESAKLEKKLPRNNFLSISLPLRNTADTVSLLDPSKTIVSEISYKKAPDGNSLNFFKQGDYRWSNHITKETKNILNNPPETKKTDIPDTAYLDVPVAFSASGRDGDDEKVRYTWDFGDGHKSYKGETTHRYEKKGKYQGMLTISDGTEDAVTKFSLEVKKYEAPKVRMVSLTPNPKGKDSDTENIEIENRSKKSVDLLGWSVATGWKKLINHPIRESFVIEGKSKRFLTRDFSSFTLPNGKGKIELRSPDGETVQKMKYNLKGKSAEEDARIMKEKGGKWTWTLNQGAVSNEQRAIRTADAPPAGGTTVVREQRREISKEEKQLEQDTEIITLKKERGEKLVSTEKNPKEEMRRLIGFGTDIETPLAILEDIPRVAGTSDDFPRKNTSASADDTFDFNAIMNDWLANE